MAKRVSAAEAKAKLSALVAEVAYGGQHIVIERRGKAMAAIVSVAELEQLEQTQPPSPQPRGALAIVGLWKDVPDEDIDAFLEDVYESRENATGRPVEIEA